MIKELSVPVDIDGNELVMTANIGVGVYPVDGEDAETLLSNSKMALYKAIEKGRGEYLFYNKEMNHLSKLSLKIESQLHQAIEKEELYLNYQPIVNMETGRIEKFEALLRWKHPEFGLVSPATFIEIAEHAGIIKSIGKWVIQRAVRQLKTWHNNGHSHLLMSINLSAVQFHQTHLADDIIEIVDQEGVSPQSIVFELTETVLLKSVDHVRKIIFQLHEAGFGFALDDFGTGYSSLEHLHKFPIQWIKIDKSFMDDFPSDVHAVSIVSGLIGLSHNLGMHVITEGIENESQLLILRNLKCDEAQGYLLSRPLSGTDATIFLDTTGSHRMIRKINASQDVPAKELDSRSVVEILNTPPV
jgi:EAL domain-containing protein (putative c-di-GMP-specific phosphodiesterase class I)